LKLYFPIQDSDGKNKNVVETILEANKWVLNKRGSNQSFRNFDFSFLTEDPERYVIESEKSINNLSNVISSYLKEEWNKSKTGKWNATIRKPSINEELFFTFVCFSFLLSLLYDKVDK
jgi:hypothetical protein